MKASSTAILLLASLCLSSCEERRADRLAGERSINLHSSTKLFNVGLHSGVSAAKDSSIFSPFVSAKFVELKETSARRRTKRRKRRGPIGNILTILSRIRTFFSKKSLMQKAEVDEALDKYVASARGRHILACAHPLPEEEAKKKAEKFCKQFKEEEIKKMCTSYINEAIKLIDDAANKCNKPVKGDCLLDNLQLPLAHPLLTQRDENFNYSLKDVSLPGFSLTDFNLDNRWQQIDKIKKLFQVQFPSRWGLENRVEKKIKKLREKSNKDKKQKNKDKHFWTAWQLITRALISKPQVESMMIRLVMMFISFRSCSRKPISISIQKRKENAAAADARRKALLSAISNTLHIEDCRETEHKNLNCILLFKFTSLQKQIKLVWLSLHEENPPTQDIPPIIIKTTADVQQEMNINNAFISLKEEIEENLQADTTFVNTVADSLGTKMLNVLGSSRAARAIITKIVSGVLGFVEKLRSRSKKTSISSSSKSKADRKEQKKRENKERETIIISKSQISATAFLLGAGRAASVYSMSAKIGMAELQSAIMKNVLKKKLRAERKKQQPKKTIKERLRLGRRSKKPSKQQQIQQQQQQEKQEKEKEKEISFISSSSFSSLSHGEKIKANGSVTRSCGSLCRDLLKMKYISLLQRVKEQTGMGTTEKMILGGGAFLFIGISMIGSLVPGGLIAGLIIAGIISMLIPLIKRVLAFFSGKKPSARKEIEGGEETAEEEEEEIAGGIPERGHETMEEEEE